MHTRHATCVERNSRERHSSTHHVMLHLSADLSRAVKGVAVAHEVKELDVPLELDQLRLDPLHHARWHLFPPKRGGGNCLSRGLWRRRRLGELRNSGRGLFPEETGVLGLLLPLLPRDPLLLQLRLLQLHQLLLLATALFHPIRARGPRR